MIQQCLATGTQFIEENANEISMQMPLDKTIFMNFFFFLIIPFLNKDTHFKGGLAYSFQHHSHFQAQVPSAGPTAHP